MEIEKYGVSYEFISQFEYPDLKPGDQDWRWCHKYSHDILKGNISACKKMKWAALRHFQDLQREDIYFDEHEADLVVRWFKFCPITDSDDPRLLGKPMELDPVQIFMSSSLAAWKWSDDTYDEDGIPLTIKGKRRFSQAFCLVARKWGKSSWIANLNLFFMKRILARPRCFTLATKRDQAKEVWSNAWHTINASPQLSRYFQTRANEILVPSKGGEFRPLASDSKSLDGLNPDIATLDECHAIKDRNLYGVIRSAFGAKTEFLFAVITTAGFILDGLCTDLYKNGESVLDPDKPEITQDNYFYAIYEIDKGDDWSDPKNWYKSNPSLVYGRPSMKMLRDAYTEASMSTEEKANFLTKHCNLFVNGSDKWLDMDLVRACEKSKEYIKEKVESYRKEGRKCYAAIDRASVNDICSSTLLFPNDDGGVLLDFVNFIAQEGYQNAGNHLKSVYNKAIEDGDLVLLRTRTVRNEPIEELIAEWFEDYNLEAFHYDPWHMREICENMEDKGYTMVAVSQSTGNMSEPAKNLEGLIAEGLMEYNSRLFEFACENALMGMTRKNNMDIFRDPKNWKTEKIDPLISTIIALSGATLIKNERNIYEDRGLFSV
ncbi:terminase large subunit [Vibrio phage Artemius]|nr:terminase large subunit [Vibrio phage Artemius]